MNYGWLLISCLTFNKTAILFSSTALTYASTYCMSLKYWSFKWSVLLNVEHDNFIVYFDIIIAWNRLLTSIILFFS